MNDLLTPKHCVSNNLHQTARAVNRIYSEEMRATGLKRSQYSILGYLNKLEKTHLSQLADLMFMDRTTLSRNLRPLERSGLIDISTSDKDARAKQLSLTPEGKAAFRTATKHWRRAQKKVIASFGADNWTQLEASLSTLRNTRVLHE